MDFKETTRTLVEKAQQGDRTAFEALEGRFRSRLEALIHSRLGKHLQTRVTVDDVIQETLLRAFRTIGRFRWESDDSFFRWLGAIAEHVILKESERYERGRQIRLEPIRTVEDTTASRAMRRDERFERLRSAIDCLSPDHRQVILWARIEGLKIKEIAERMDRSESAVKNLLLRALKELRESFGDTESLHLPDRSLTDEEDSR